MTSRLFMMFLGVLAGSPVGLFDRAAGQEIGSISQSGESLAESLKQSTANQPYNMKIGPVKLRAEADLTFSFNDNIGLSKNGRLADIIATPMGVIHGNWQVSDLNTLTFNLGIGYQAYLFHSQYNNLVLAPDSAAQFNFFIGDVALNVYDSFSYQQDPTAVGQLSNQVRLIRLQNSAGFGAKWDLGDIMVEADYQHANFWVTQSIYDYLTNQSDTLSPKVTVKLDEAISTGVSLSFSDTRYQQGFQNDNVSASGGPFVNATLSKNLSLTAQLGGLLTQYDHGGGNGDNSQIASYYGNIGLNHQINDVWSESLTAGRQYLPGLTSNYTDQFYANYGNSWQATKTIAVSSGLSWQNLSDSGGAAFRETSNIFGANLGLADTLSKDATVNFNYQFSLKDANPSILSYYQNVGTVGMQYNF